MSDLTEKVYVAGDRAYSVEYRQFSDPSLVTARKNNVTLPYSKCNQIFKGPSQFVDPAARLLFLSLNATNKEDMEKSQVTMDCSQMHQSFHSESKKKSVHRTVSMQQNSGENQFSNQTKRVGKNLSESTHSWQTYKNGGQLVKSNIIPSTHNNAETNNHCDLGERVGKFSRSLSFGGDLDEVISENEAESQDVQELKHLLSSKNRQIAYFKSQIRKAHTREQILQNKLKIIHEISANRQDNPLSEQELQRQLSVISQVLHSISKPSGTLIHRNTIS